MTGGRTVSDLFFTLHIYITMRTNVGPSFRHMGVPAMEIGNEPI